MLKIYIWIIIFNDILYYYTRCS